VEPRSTAQRKADVLEKLRTDVDIWVASASAAGKAYLIPLSFYWDGTRLTVATPKNSRTARNLQRAGVARMALGPTRDVVLLEGSLKFIPVGADAELAFQLLHQSRRVHKRHALDVFFHLFSRYFCHGSFPFL